MRVTNTQVMSTDGFLTRARFGTRLVGYCLVGPLIAGALASIAIPLFLVNKPIIGHHTLRDVIGFSWTSFITSSLANIPLYLILGYVIGFIPALATALLMAMPAFTRINTSRAIPMAMVFGGVTTAVFFKAMSVAMRAPILGTDAASMLLLDASIGALAGAAGAYANKKIVQRGEAYPSIN